MSFQTGKYFGCSTVIDTCPVVKVLPCTMLVPSLIRFYSLHACLILKKWLHTTWLAGLLNACFRINRFYVWPQIVHRTWTFEFFSSVPRILTCEVLLWSYYWSGNMLFTSTSLILGRGQVHEGYMKTVHRIFLDAVVHSISTVSIWGNWAYSRLRPAALMLTVGRFVGALRISCCCPLDSSFKMPKGFSCSSLSSMTELWAPPFFRSVTFSLSSGNIQGSYVHRLAECTVLIPLYCPHGKFCP